MAQEFQQKRSNEYNPAGSGKMDGGQLGKSYGFRKEGRGLASQTNKFIEGKFKTLISPKNGYIVSDCVNLRKRRVLEFVVPVLYVEKPN